MKNKNQKLKILFICQNFWPENFRSTDVVNNLVEYGNKIEVLTSNPNYPEGKIYKGYSWYNFKTEKLNKNIKVHRVPTFPRGKSSYFLILINYIGFIIFGTLFGLFKLRNQKFDVILVFASSPIFQVIVGFCIKLFKNIKLITWVQDLWPENLKALKIVKNKILLNIIKIITGKIYNLNDAIIAQSESFKKILIKRTNKKIYFIPNYAENFKIKNLKFKLKKNNKFTLVYAGNIGKAQKLMTLLKSAKKFKNNKKLQIKIFGDGQELNSLRRYKKINNIQNVNFYGKVSKEKIYVEYKMADALYLGLAKDKFLNFTIPAKLQTYLYISKPIISTASGETKKIIEKAKIGLCSNPENSHLLYKNLDKMVRYKKKNLKVFEKNCKKFFKENYSKKKINKKLTQVLKAYKK